MEDAVIAPDEWSAAIFKADLTAQLDVTALITSFQGAVRHLAPGEWTATIAAPSLDDVLQLWPGQTDMPPLGFALQALGQIVISGAVTTLSYEKSGGTVTMTMSGVDEYAALHTRIVYPQPVDSPPWTTSPYHAFTGLASNAVADFIVRQIGVSARPERLDPVTVIPADSGVTGTWQFRAGFLDEAVTEVATEAGLAVRCERRNSDAGLDIYVGPVINRTDFVLDDTLLGDSTLTFQVAEATTVIAGGTGEGTARLFAIAGDEVTGVARRETFSDQNNITSQPALLRSAQATRSTMAASATFAGSLTAEAADLYLWRRDYHLGDLITLRVGSSQWVVQVSGVTITIDPSVGMLVSPMLGFKPKNALVRLLKDVAGISSRLRNVEVR